MMKKKTVNNILIILILITQLLTAFPYFVNTVDSTQSTIDASAGTTYATSYSYNRKIARGLNGSLYAVYQRDTGAGVLNIFFSKSNDEGSTWSTPLQMTTDASYDAREDPAICIDSNDMLHVAYYLGRGGKYYLNYTYSTDYGATWSTPVNINGGTSSFTHAPSLAVDSHDLLYCFWAGRYSGGPAVNGVCYKIRNPTTGIWSSITQLNSDGASQFQSVCIDNNNNVHVSWSGYHTGSPAIYQIRYKKYIYATSTWGATTNITNVVGATYGQGRTSIVVNNTNVIHVFWDGRNDTAPHGSVKQIQHRSFDGVTWSSISFLTDSTMDINFPSATVTTNDTLYVIYYGYFGYATRNVFYSVQSSTGSWSSPTVLISDATEDRYPSVLYANYPYLYSMRTNRPKTGLLLIWSADTTVKYYATTDLSWDGDTFVVLHPTSTGVMSDFDVYGASTHWDAVNDLSCDYNVTYVASSPSVPIYEYDIYGFEDITLTSEMVSVTNVTIYAWMREPTSSGYTGDLIFFHGYVGYNKGAFPLTTSWALYSWKMSTNPHTGLPWTFSDIDDFAGGIRSFGSANCSQVYVVVNFSSFGWGSPTVSFASDSTTDGIKLYNNYINANLTSASGTSGTHYTVLDLNSDIVLWERFEQMTPDDSSTYGNDGAIHGTAQQSLALGPYGKYYDFDGADDYITIPSSTSLNNTDETLTVSLWANSTDDYSLFPTTNRGFGGVYYNNTNRIYWCVRADGRVALYDRLIGAGNYLYLTSALPVNYIKSWHNYIFVFTSTNITLYLDGVYAGATNFNPPTLPNLASLNNGFVTQIGRGGQGSDFDWKGSIDDYIIFDRCLNLTEIKSLYDANITQYNRNFTNMPNDNYTFKGYAVNHMGYIESTETRWCNISLLAAPTIILISPTPNGTLTGALRTNCQVQINDNNPGDTITATWQENSTGVWVTRQVDAGITPGDTISWIYSQATNLSQKYWFRVYANDTTFNSSATFCFTTITSYNFIKGLPNGLIDWDGLPGTVQWCNSTGFTNETMEINMTASGTNTIDNVGVWIGDLALTYTHAFTAGWNNITLPDWVINACESDFPADVFSSVIGYVNYIIGYNTYGETKVWYYNETNQTLQPLQHILPDCNYQVYLTQICTLSITSDTLLTASNISIQFSSDNTTWGTNTQTFADGGNIIVTNISNWNNANGCYGSNPFFPTITGRTQSVYCRFKLNIPLYMPSDQSYLSLSDLNCKVYIYSDLGANTTLPPTYAPTLPSGSDYFLLKWQDTLTTLGIYFASPPVISDVDGDGIQEIFCSGRISSAPGNTGVTLCLNGTTGALIWKHGWNTGYSSSDDEQQFPLFIYDVNKDGRKEVIQSSGTGHTICMDAQTGIDVWNVSIGSGWHQQGYIDYGNEVILYIVGDNYIHKLYGSNGTLIKQTIHYYTCWSGVSIGDINNDGRYEIVIGGRNNGYGGGVYGGMRVYDDDLNLLWSKTFILDSTGCVNLFDYNGDGVLDVFVADQGSDTYYVYDGFGNQLYHSPASGFHFHVQNTMADVDNDGHLEMISGDSGTGYTSIYDIVTHTFDHVFTENYFYPPDVGNVILDSGDVDNRYEIIATSSSSAKIYKYNSTTGIYDVKYTFPNSAFFGITQDIDHDGYNELLLASGTYLKVYETQVPASTPRTLTNVNYYGLRRMNDNLYDAPPYYYEPFYTVLSFGSSAYITTLSPTTFIYSAASSNSLVEYNGFYNKGEYTTWVNATVYTPTGWTLNHIYFRMMNGTTVYQNITSGFIATNVNTTFKKYCLLYNPSVLMNGKFNCNVDVYVDLSYNGIPLFNGNKTFNNVFTIYHIEPPYNWISHYNTSLQSINMSWTAGHYTNRYIVVRKTGTSYPTTPTDGTVVQNATKTSYNESAVYTSRAYSVFGYNSTSRSYSDALNIPWGAIGVSCFNESNPSRAIPFDLEVSNQAGTIVYKRTGLHNIHYIDVQNIPYGTNTIFIVESNGYKQRIYYKDIALNNFYNYSFYLPPSTSTTGGGSNTTTGCVERTAVDSIYVGSYTVDATITLQHTLEEMISVELYNISLYGSYGGWIFVASSKYTTTSNSVTVNKTILDKNTSMLRVTYYYMYCPGEVITTPLYYIRIVETVREVDQPIENAKVTIKRYVNTTGIYVPVAELITDANGYCNVYLLPGTLYKVLVTKTGYDDMLADYIPLPPNNYGQTLEKVFRIVKTAANGTVTPADYQFTNIVWTIEPTTFYFYNSITVWYNITSSNSHLVWYKASIYILNTSTYAWALLNTNNISSTSGGSISFNIPNVTGEYAFVCSFGKLNFSTYVFTTRIYYIYIQTTFQQKVELISPEIYLGITIFAMLTIMGVLAMLGVGAISGMAGLLVEGICFAFRPDISFSGVSVWFIFLATAIAFFFLMFIQRGR